MMLHPPSHINSLKTLAICFALLLSGNAIGQSAGCEAFDVATAANSNLTVGAVKVNANDIFDPSIASENEFIHQLGNRLHKQTRREVIERQLLFKTGDKFDLARVEESERLLRQNVYLKSATVTPAEQCGNTVTILVTTFDHWSLIPKFVFTRTGGENRAGFEITEANLFGRGKELALAYEQGTERDQTIFEYKDKHVLGGRQQLTFQLQDNTDGKRELLELRLPFYAFSSTRSWRIAVDNSQLISRLYTDRKATALLDVEQRYADINYGMSDGLHNDALHRYWIGARFDETEIRDLTAADTVTTLPVRRFVYPYLAWQMQKPEFVKQKNLFMMDRVEDVSLGHFFETRIGYASKQFDSTVDALTIFTEYRKGWQGNHSLGLLNAKLSTFRTEDDFANTVIRPELRWFWFQSNRRTLFLSAKAAIGNNLFVENQFLAGGNTGLRGYPLRMQSGNRRVVLSAEQRWYLDWYPWQLLRIGAATFIDAGTAWDSAVGDDPEWLANAGVGIRVLLTRQANAPVTHIDLAVPFDQTDGIDKYQLVILSKATF